MIASWPCPLPDGGTADELAVLVGAEASTRILIIPPLFDEHNKLRRFLVEVMRILADANCACVLPDIPGLNESTQPLENQSIAAWKDCISTAINHFEATHVLTARSGGILMPQTARGWSYEPQTGAKLLRGMIRARTIASKEAGTAETTESLNEAGRTDGITLNGWPISARLFHDLETAEPAQSDNIALIEQSLMGGSGLWLRAEPDEDTVQADALATAILEDLGPELTGAPV